MAWQGGLTVSDYSHLLRLLPGVCLGVPGEPPSYSLSCCSGEGKTSRWGPGPPKRTTRLQALFPGSPGGLGDGGGTAEASLRSAAPPWDAQYGLKVQGGAACGQEHLASLCPFVCPLTLGGVTQGPGRHLQPPTGQLAGSGVRVPATW